VHLIYRGIRPILARRRLVRRTRRAVSALIREHIPTLARKRATLVKKDDYGIVHYDEWEQEKNYFIDVVLREHFSTILTEDFPLSATHLDTMIEKAIEAFLHDLYGDMSVAEPHEETWDANGQHSYRQYCLKLLELSGWKVLTEGSAARAESPILAERDGKRFAVTCVNASSHVGGGMIRRASSARKKLGAHMAAVVTNGEYSKWARMVSSRYRVMPLHHEDLANI
jgi:restriction system protein